VGVGNAAEGRKEKEKNEIFYEGGRTGARATIEGGGSQRGGRKTRPGVTYPEHTPGDQKGAIPSPFVEGGKKWL